MSKYPTLVVIAFLLMSAGAALRKDYEPTPGNLFWAIALMIFFSLTAAYLMLYFLSSIGNGKVGDEDSLIPGFYKALHIIEPRGATILILKDIRGRLYAHRYSGPVIEGYWYRAQSTGEDFGKDIQRMRLVQVDPQDETAVQVLERGYVPQWLKA